VRTEATNNTEPAYVVKGNIVQCGSGTIYAFVHVPAREVKPPEPAAVRFWADNLIWIVLGFCAVGAIFAAIFYVFKRLHRYRKKYKETDKEVNKMQEEVDEMEQFGGAAGNKDEALEMMSNPMVIQMQDMQAQLDRKNKEVLAEEEQNKAAESHARQEHIGKLQTDRDDLAAELERLKAELQAAEVPAAAHVATEVEAPTEPKKHKRTDTAVRAQIDDKPMAARKKKNVD